MLKRKKISLFDMGITLIMVLVLCVTIFPLYFSVIASVSDPGALAKGEVIFLPKGFTLDAYKHVFEHEEIWNGYKNTIFYTVFGTLLSLVTTIPTAYCLEKKYLLCKKEFNIFYLISMYFGGGLVPTYLTIKSLKLYDTRAILVIMGCFSVYNMIVARSYFRSNIPEELYEAAEMDGAGEFWKFFKIAIPLAKSIIAVMCLYYAVSYWNSYYSALVYTSNRDFEPLQLVLRRVLIMNQNLIDEAEVGSFTKEELQDSVARANLAYTMKYALVFIASLPLLIMYPFVQKYFVKGAMVGSVKS